MGSYEEFLSKIDEVIKKVPQEEREPIKRIFFETWNKTFQQNPKDSISQFIINFQELKKEFPFLQEYMATTLLAEAMTDFFFEKEEARV